MNPNKETLKPFSRWSQITKVLLFDDYPTSEELNHGPSLTFSAWQELFKTHQSFLKGSRVSSIVRSAASQMKEPGKALKTPTAHTLRQQPQTLKNPMQNPIQKPGTALREKAIKTFSSGKIFRSSPSLRELMGEYNKRNHRLSPIKARQEAFSTPVSSRHFQQEGSIDYIEIPSLPGKILRPTP